MNRSTFALYSKWCDANKARAASELEQAKQVVAQADQAHGETQKRLEDLDAMAHEALCEDGSLQLIKLINLEQTLLEQRLALQHAELRHQRELLASTRTRLEGATQKATVRDRIQEKMRKERITTMLKEEQRELDEVSQRLSFPKPNKT